MVGAQNIRRPIFIGIIDQRTATVPRTFRQNHNDTANAAFLRAPGIAFGAIGIFMAGQRSTKPEAQPSSLLQLLLGSAIVLLVIGVIDAEQLKAPLPSYRRRFVVFYDRCFPFDEAGHKLAGRTVVAKGIGAQHLLAVFAVHE